jgi:hypothetical protein
MTKRQEVNILFASDASQLVALRISHSNDPFKAMIRRWMGIRHRQADHESSVQTIELSLTLLIIQMEH